ncbi:MAG: hypothetical protein ACFFBR_08565 [Promethearchaeota archaeon]
MSSRTRLLTFLRNLSKEVDDCYNIFIFYAHICKEVYALPRDVIEERFNLIGNEGVAFQYG